MNSIKKTEIKLNRNTSLIVNRLLTVGAICALALPAYAAQIVDGANTKSVGPVVWHKRAAVDPMQLINQPIPKGSISLFFIRPADADTTQTSVNISINDRFQASLQPGNFTQVYSCAGRNQISAVITGKKSNNLTENANAFDLAADAAYFFYVDVDEAGHEKIQQITADSAKQVLATKQYQQHQISRVVPNCPIVVQVPVAATPVKVAPAPMPAPKLEQQVSIELKVLFDNDKSVIKPEYYQEVKEVADFMQQYPNAQAVIEGHTDSRGASAYNQQLSQRRADAVKQVLVEQFGIASYRLSAVGYGESKPIADNGTDSGRAQNRRVIAVINESR